MSRQRMYQLWETYSVDLLQCIRRELVAAGNFFELPVIDKIIEKKLQKD